MGVAETLLHTHDITLGLGVPWQPPQRLSALVLRRLFPDAPAGAAPEVLLWMTGRGELPGRARRTSWSSAGRRSGTDLRTQPTAAVGGRRRRRPPTTLVCPSRRGASTGDDDEFSTVRSS